MIVDQILWTACITPFEDSGFRVDYKSFEYILRMQERAGNGILVLGSTGESLSIDEKERREILEFVCGLNLGAKIMCGVPSYNLFSAMDWIEFCNDMPINGYLMATPMYTKPGISGQTEWFNRLLNKSKHEAMLYNIPGRAGIKLHSEVVKNLKDHENFVALKDSSGVVDSLVEYKIAAPNISIFCGDDYMMPSTAIEGAAGLVSVISNAFPDETRKYVEYALRGNKMKSKIWWQACKALFAASNPIPIKALMKDIGLIKSDDVRLPLSLEDLVNRSDLMKYFDLIKDWGHNLKDEI